MAGFRILLLIGDGDAPAFHPDPAPHYAAAIEQGNELIRRLRDAGVRCARYVVVPPAHG